MMRKQLALAALMALAGPALAVGGPDISQRESDEPTPPKAPRRERVDKPYQGAKEMARRRRQMERNR